MYPMGYGTGLEPRHVLYLSENKLKRRHTEAEFFDILGTKVKFSSLLFTVTSTNKFNPPFPHSSLLELKRFETGLCVYGYLKSENSRDYAKKPQ